MECLHSHDCFGMSLGWDLWNFLDAASGMGGALSVSHAFGGPLLGWRLPVRWGWKPSVPRCQKKTSPWWFFPICVRGGFPDNNKRQRQSTACFSGHSLSAISQATLGLTSCTISFVTQDDHCCTTNSFFVLGACRSCERERENDWWSVIMFTHVMCR